MTALLALNHPLTPAGSIDVRDLGADLAVIALVTDTQGAVLGLQLGMPSSKVGLQVICCEHAIRRALTAFEIVILPMALALTDRRGLMLKATTGFNPSRLKLPSGLRAKVMAEVSGWPIAYNRRHPFRET